MPVRGPMYSQGPTFVAQLGAIHLTGIAYDLAVLGSFAAMLPTLPTWLWCCSCRGFSLPGRLSLQGADHAPAVYCLARICCLEGHRRHHCHKAGFALLLVSLLAFG